MLKKLFFTLYILINTLCCTFQPNNLSYLKSNQETIDSKKPVYKILDDSFYKNQVFFLGESHGIAKNFEFEFLKNLKAKTNFKYILAENTYSNTLLLNKYLETGNTDYLKEVLSNAKGTFFYSREELQRWKNIYQLNQTIQPKDRLKVLGIDIEHNVFQSLNTICKIATEKNSKKASNNKLYSLIFNCNKKLNSEQEKLKFIGNSEILLSEIINDFQKNQKYYQDIFKNDYFTFLYLLENTNSVFFCAKNKQKNQCRDEKMFENFQKLVKHYKLEDQVFYGVWGYAHIFQHPYKQIDWLASRIKKSNLKLKDKIVSLNLIYLNSKKIKLHNSMPSPKSQITIEDFSQDQGPDKIKGIELLKQITQPKSINIFKLNNVNSPYQRNLSLINEDANQSVTTDYYQYIILIRDSLSTTYLDPY
jgi:hypothetical protein